MDTEPERKEPNVPNQGTELDPLREQIRNELEKRAVWILNKILPNLNVDGWRGKIWMAGGCMLPGEPNDVDLFQTPWNAHPEVAARMVQETKNATTYAADPWPIQICRYTEESLRKLIEAFDFSFNQVGAAVSIEFGCIGPVRVEFTDTFVFSMASGRVDFMGSEYPLSSLLRVQKYFKSGRMSRRDSIKCTAQILAAVVRRGFSDREDFKDQLDAVDLGLVESDVEDALPGLEDLYQLLLK